MSSLRRMSGLLVMVALPAIALAAAPPGPAGAVSVAGSYGTGAYELIELGTLGGSLSDATSVNDRGQVVGWSHTADGVLRPFLWQHGTMTALPSLGPPTEQGYAGSAMDINDHGDVVGVSSTATGDVHAVMWRRDRVIDLGTLGTSSWAVAVNNRREVVGFSDHPDGGEHAFLWKNGRMADLGASAPFTVRDINDRTSIVGNLLPRPEAPVAALWRHGRVQRLGGPDSAANAINERGEIVGSSTAGTTGAVRAVLWQNGKGRKLARLPGESASAAVGINDRAQILGWSANRQQQRISVLWQRGAVIDLSARGVPVDTFPAALNNRGDIAGTLPSNGVYGRAALFRHR